jgi:hypothetical protein
MRTKPNVLHGKNKKSWNRDTNRTKGQIDHTRSARAKRLTLERQVDRLNKEEMRHGR